MIYCNYCDASIPFLSRQAIQEGWGQIKCNLSRTTSKKGYDSTEISSKIIITFCPQHFQESFDDLMQRVATANSYLYGISFKEEPKNETDGLHDTVG